MITGLNSGKNCIENGYPFIEAILSKLPLCDEYFVSDGGSTDGTYEALLELAEVYPKIKVFLWPDEENIRWDSCSTASNRFIQMAKPGWIYLDNMDELIHEQDISALHKRVLDERIADVFRYDRKEIVKRWSKLTDDVYWPARTARLIPGLFMDWNMYGGDEFLDPSGWIKDPPRCQKIPFKIYHFHAVFPKNIMNKRRNDALGIAPGDVLRVKIWEQIKHGSFDTMKIPEPKEVYDDLPALSRDLAFMREYVVRRKLFDPEWVSSLTGLKYA